VRTHVSEAAHSAPLTLYAPLGKPFVPMMAFFSDNPIKNCVTTPIRGSHGHQVVPTYTTTTQCAPVLSDQLCDTMI
jgi:hypothetical protein